MKGVFGLVALSETTAKKRAKKTWGFPRFFVTKIRCLSHFSYEQKREAYLGDTPLQGAEDDVTFAE